MLANNEYPVAWAMLMYELDDAREHLTELIAKMSDAGKIDECDYRIWMGHIYAHLNRAWHGRNDENLENVLEESDEERSKFPIDLEVVG